MASLPEDVEKIFREKRKEDSIASWALRWVGTHSNVKVILSGMSTYEQVLNNLETFKNFQILDEEEQKLVEKVAATIRSRVKNGCTACQYCMPCPFGVDIPRSFAIWNEEAMYGNKEAAKWRYFQQTDESKRADKCQKCGACEQKCPQGIHIRDDLEQLEREIHSW